MKYTIMLSLIVLTTLTQVFAADPPAETPPTTPTAVPAAAPPTVPAAVATAVPVVVPIDKDGVQRVDILGSDYFFKPARIVVKVNVPVELNVRKDGYIVPHNIVIEAPQAGIKVNESLSHDPKAIKFTPTKVGKYPMFCNNKLPFLASHREKGMEGLLEVVE